MSQQDIDATEAPLLEHLIELRRRLIYCVIGLAAAFIVSFALSTQIFNLLILPFKWGTGRSVELIQTELLGFFFVKLKIGFFGAMFITFPLIAIQIYRFVAPGLYSNERNAFRPYLIATPIFFLLGACARLFRPAAGRDQVLLQPRRGHGRRRPGAGPAHAGRAVLSRLRHDADPGLWPVLPVAGDPDAARPDRHRELRAAQERAANSRLSACSRLPRS